MAYSGQAEVGLPGKINLLARYGQFEDMEMLGGGLRFGLITPGADIPFPPAISVSAL